MNRTSLRNETRGAVFVEHIIAYLPVIFFFLATWQLIELCAAHLIVKRAASAAARAAVVVLPDDPAFYHGAPQDEFVDDGKNERGKDVRLAATMILAANPHFLSADPKIEITKASGELTATVRASFSCAGGWASLVCGPSGRRQLSAKSTYLYQGASFSYEL